MDSNHHMDVTARAVHEKKPIPEIDFTLHTMEDGNQVSTQERVCKGMRYFSKWRESMLTISSFQMCKRPRSIHLRRSNSSLLMIATSPTFNFSSNTSTERGG